MFSKYLNTANISVGVLKRYGNTDRNKEGLESNIVDNSNLERRVGR